MKTIVIASLLLCSCVAQVESASRTSESTGSTAEAQILVRVIDSQSGTVRFKVVDSPQELFDLAATIPATSSLSGVTLSASQDRGMPWIQEGQGPDVAQNALCPMVVPVR